MNFKILTRVGDDQKIPVNLDLVRWMDPDPQGTVLVFDGSTDRGQNQERGEFDVEPIRVLLADTVIVSETVDEILLP